MHIYIRKLFEHDASGHQISFSKDVALNFFNAPKSFIDRSQNIKIHVFHYKESELFYDIELQPARDYRFSTSLNSLLAQKDGPIQEGDLLYVEKIGLSYGVKTIKSSDANYETFNALLNEKDRHFLLCMDDDNDNSENEDLESQAPLSDLTEKGLKANEYRPFITAIKSKPFLLLAGISGTGKSRIVRELARACWPKDSDEYKSHKPRNFEMIQVRPNWHDSSELLGYVSRIGADKEGNGIVYVIGEFLRFIIKAWTEPNIPYFLCLDEMNLAPVEQYFAEYLSVIESRKKEGNQVVTDPILKSDEQWFYDLTSKGFVIEECREQFNKYGISIPENLIVVGTVNMDESTFSFSRKVLDRAMTIEMNHVDLNGGLTTKYEEIGLLGRTELIGTNIEGIDIYADNKDVCDVVIKYLKAVNSILEKTPFKIAYRTRNEFLLYIVNNLPYNEGDDGSLLSQGYVIARSLDEITSMKILSRIEGDETKVSEKFLRDLSSTIKEQLSAISGEEFVEELPDTVLDAQKINLSISLSKLLEMRTKLSSGYTSFWN